MLVTTGTYTGSAVPQFIQAGFTPELVIIKGASNVARFYHPWNWERGTQGFGSNSSGSSAGGQTKMINTIPGGFSISGSTDINTAATVYHWVAFSDNLSGHLKTFAFDGTGIDGQLYSGLMNNKPAVLMTKRDSPEYGHIKTSLHAVDVSKPFNAAAESSDIKVLNTNGSFTVSNDSSINERTAGLGEATDCFAFYPGEGVQVQTYTGTGAEQVIATTVANPKFVISIPTTARLITFKTDTMGTNAANGQATALTADSITAIGASSVTLGTGASANNSGDDYYLVTIGATETQEMREPVSKGSQNSMFNASTYNLKGGYVSGQSDTLSIAGAITLEWHGEISEMLTGNSYSFLMTRANNSLGGAATAGAYSWGIAYSQVNGGVNVCTSNFFDTANSDSDNRNRWRTGYIPVEGSIPHMVFTHDGSGNWGMYIDGVLRKVKYYDMTAHGTGYPNIAGNSADWTTIQGRAHNAGDHSYDENGGTLLNVRIYDRELSAAEIMTRYKYQKLNNKTLPDVGDFVEEWCDTVGGTSTLPATNTSANNGQSRRNITGWSLING